MGGPSIEARETSANDGFKTDISTTDAEVETRGFEFDSLDFGIVKWIAAHRVGWSLEI